MDIQTRIEGKRGCGYRQPGGLYLVADALTRTCPLLPFKTEVCGACGAGIKYARGWTWINPLKLFGEKVINDVCASRCFPLKVKDDLLRPCFFEHDEAGLLWVGQSFYPTSGMFVKEAAKMGVSRRIKTVPRKFKVNHHWVLLAHIQGFENKDKGIFSAFVPRRIEYVVKDDDDQEKLEDMEKRGITLVKVVPLQQGLLEGGEEE